jgi:hypothetical protein
MDVPIADESQRRARLQAGRYETRREVLEIVRSELENMSQFEDTSGASESRADSPRNDKPAEMASNISHSGEDDTFVYTMPGAFDF